MRPRSKGPSPVRLLIVERALRDIRDIEAFSIARWGEETASKYVERIEAALNRILEQPGPAV